MPISKERCVIIARPKNGVDYQHVLGISPNLKLARECAAQYSSKNSDEIYEVYQLAAAFESEKTYNVKEL